MARTLLDFVNKHKNETAWVFGKGPTLDGYDFDRAGKLRCGINEVVQYVPNCTYAFSNDSVRLWQEIYTPDQILFQPLRTAEHRIPSGKTLCEIVIFDDDYGDDRAFLPRKEQARDGISIRHGTLGSLLQILNIMGVARIVAVGIDGGGKRAENYKWTTPIRNDHARDYNNIRNQFILGASMLGIDLEIIGTQPNQPKNGMIRILTTRNVSISGRSFYHGEIVEVTPEDAAMVIGAGKAEMFHEGPQKRSKPMDTTTIEPRTEKATVTKRRTRRRKVS